jgi:hypothetical protein
MTTAVEVAKWMVAELDRTQLLDQELTVYEISKKFGDEFTYINPNGNLAISKDVLKHFNKITAADVVWSRSERHWRKRQPGDEPGRMQY